MPPELAWPCPQSALKSIERADAVFDHGGLHVFDPSAFRNLSRHRGEHRLVNRDFLDEFSARPTGVLVATAQLVGEGYDDPSIDAVVTAER
jgi:hypothetical protein